MIKKLILARILFQKTNNAQGVKKNYVSLAGSGLGMQVTDLEGTLRIYFSNTK